MQTIISKPSGLRTDALWALAGAALAVSGVGAVLALEGLDSPLRAPFALFYLLVAPAAGLGAALRTTTPGARITLSAAGAVLIDLAVAQSMRALDLWSAGRGVTAVAAVTFCLFLFAMRNRCTHLGPWRKKK